VVPKSHAVGLILALALLGCYAAPPYESKDHEELSRLVQQRFPSGSSLDAAIRDLESQGFKCSDLHDSSVRSMRPRGPNDELPFHCTWRRAAIPFVCSESWLIVLVPDGDSVFSTSAGYNHACL